MMYRCTYVALWLCGWRAQSVLLTVLHWWRRCAIKCRPKLLIADNLRHMQIEEAQNNAALWQLLDDEGLHALHAALELARSILDASSFSKLIRAIGLYPQTLAA